MGEQDEDGDFGVPESTYVVWMIMCPLSMLGGLFIMIFFIAKEKLRRHAGMHFVFWQALCDFIFSANIVVDAILHDNFDDKDRSICVAQGFFSQFFSTVRYSLIAAIDLMLIAVF